MASSNPDGSEGGFDPLTQPAFILASDGQTPINFTLADIDMVYQVATSSAANYGSQVGASFVMLAVVLVMTPRRRFRRLPAIISILALTINMIRMLLLSLFYSSSWLHFYTVVSGDVQFVSQTDYNLSVAATILSIPITILILLALIVQAWSMLQLWPSLQKWTATALSVVLVVVTIGFNFAITIIQAQAILYGNTQDASMRWIRSTYLGLITASICWFCFLFNIRLVIHMWSNRSFLPSLKGLTAMDVLVITNGILMLVPVLFAALEYGDWNNFLESASLTQTSVIVVLPLGTLMAQRLANPGWFGSGRASSGGRSGQSASASSNTGTGASSKRQLLAATDSGRTTTSTAASRSYSYNNHANNGAGAAAEPGGLTSHITSEKPSLSPKQSHHADHVEMELSRIDDEDLELGIAGGGAQRGGVRVERVIERTEERVPEPARGAGHRDS
ncbi:pheromone receptor 2 [Lasiosphaeria ovina]|uniref:Pheromone receptor 2 n=1 Tax=Lasiosphaeria ovina TaxID=92902 RepID=A0AAE0KFW3_9PEZI|nr:pheromone receptor 2 [Lasiosphaeria ovina]